jgi:hypothetical protein
LKPHADLGCLPPHYTARTARLIAIEDEVKGGRDLAVNLYISPRFRQIANDASNGRASGPNNLCAFEGPHARRYSAVRARYCSAFLDDRSGDRAAIVGACGCFHASYMVRLEKPGYWYK